ncbi:hypothetical protein INT43_002722 [Umbelopsis isabellina]|uniref:Mediator complex subunit 9 n=1 Tax=Mortierella isabellina TaxID=91625 RepID=A0A8H7Q4D4_MORIS|nr:hypothetical protein INT43_002722 [Umbelopsis isabellina]
MAAEQNLLALIDSYASEFAACLGTILPDTPGKIKDSPTIHTDLKKYVESMTSITTSMEEKLEQVRLSTLQDKEITLEQSVASLKRDIVIKTNTIEKYTKQLQQWSKELQELEDRGRSVATRENEAHKSKDIAAESFTEHQDNSDDESDKEMFEVA